jgi:antitoxin VapB
MGDTKQKGCVVRTQKTAKKKSRTKQNAASERESGIIMAKIIPDGRSQVVRLPKDIRLEGTEVGVGRVGNAVLLYPLNDPWAVFFEGAEELSNLSELERYQI